MNLYEFAMSDPSNEWLLEQFDYEKNFPDTPKDFMKSSDKKIYFKFKCGHSCLQRIADKTGKRSKGCPVCQNRRGIGRSLADEYPQYAAMFMTEKNGIAPEQVTAKNGKVYWWKCKVCGHEFKGKVSDVVNGHRVCNMCANKKRSLPEYCLKFYLEKLDDGCEVNKKIEGRKYDLFLPKYKLAIEYDGFPWHDSKRARENDAVKDVICKERNIRLLRIRDSRLAENKDLTADVWKFDYDDELNFLSELPERLVKYMGNDAACLDINIKRDLSEIKNFRVMSDKKRSLLVHMPELPQFIDESDERNGNPEYISTASHSIRFWLRDPEFPRLKWSLTVHELFDKKEPYNQWIKMCRKMLKRYPEMAEQILEVGNNIREGTVFHMRCACGNTFEKNYVALMEKGKVELCEKCLQKVRLKNLGRL